MTSHSLIVGVLLLILGGGMLALNINEAIELRDARIAAANGKDSTRTDPANLEQVPVPDIPDSDIPVPPSGSQSPSKGIPSNGLQSRQPENGESAVPPVVNRIPRVRVAALAMPLAVGFLLLVGAAVTWVSKSEQGIQVTATLAAVAGVLMFFLGLEHAGSLLNWGADPLGRSALVLVTSGLLCLSLPSRWWWSRTNVDSSPGL
ncbi:MAG: hypothetical protein JNK57_09545 [Planctomycetaceae bacterium]|nr:hypothetical protein [Planctomycetaceae bacterium]